MRCLLCERNTGHDWWCANQGNKLSLGEQMRLLQVSTMKAKELAREELVKEDV